MFAIMLSVGLRIIPVWNSWCSYGKEVHLGELSITKNL